MDNPLVFYGVGLALIIALLYLLYLLSGRRDEPVRDVPAVLDQIGEAAILARDLVAAAEQLWLTGRLHRDKRLEYVLGQLQEYFPGLDSEQLLPLVEAAVYGLKLLKQQLPDDLPSVLDGGEGEPVGGTRYIGGRYAGTGGA